MTTLADIVLPAMEARGWSQADLSRASGVSTANLSRWISGKRIPSEDGLDAMAVALGMDADMIVAQLGRVEGVTAESTTTQMYRRMCEALKAKRATDLRLYAVQTENRELVRLNAELHKSIAMRDAQIDVLKSKLTACHERK